MSSLVLVYVPTPPTGSPPAAALANCMATTAPRDVSSDVPPVPADRTDGKPKARPPTLPSPVLATQMTNQSAATMPNPTALLSVSHRPGMPGTERLSSPVRYQKTRSKPLILPQTAYQPTGEDLENNPKGDVSKSRCLLSCRRL